MPDSEMKSSKRQALLADTILILISVLFLPAALLALVYNYAALILAPQNKLRHQIRRSARFRPQTVLIVGASSPAGLRVARAFYQTGHKVIGVDSTRYGPAIFSRALVKVHAIRALKNDDVSTYISDILKVIVKEKATILLDCTEATSSIIQAQAKAVIERRTSCVCLSVDIDLAKRLDTRHAFLTFVKETGLAMIEKHNVKSRDDIHNILNESNGKKYLLRTAGGSDSPPKRAILPGRTLSQTYHEVSQLKITSNDSWTLEQHVDGEPRYTAASLVVQGQIKAFAVYYSLDTQGGLGIVPVNSGLYQAARRYLDDVLQRLDATFSSHLCLDFYVAEKPSKSGVTQQILPLDGRFSASPATVLCTGAKGSIALTRAYMSLLAFTANGIGSYTGLPYDETHSEIAMPSETEMGVYFLGEDMRAIVAAFLRLVTDTKGFLVLCKAVVTTLGHIVSYRESLYEFWDPLPAFWYYFGQAPLALFFKRQSTYSQALGELRLVEVNGI